MDFPKSVMVTDQEVDLSRYGEAEKNFYADLLEAILLKYGSSNKSRMIIGFAGPSGSGKSTLTSILHALHGQSLPRLGIVSIDAYHFSNDYLETRELKEYKGRHDTYDCGKLVSDLELFRSGREALFPRYSRKFHEPFPDGPAFAPDEAGILLIEGLWLFSEVGKWPSVQPFLDYRYFVDVAPEVGKDRTISRHILGGRTPKAAHDFYASSDEANGRLVLHSKSSADQVIILP